MSYKVWNYMVTCRGGVNAIQIDYFLIRRIEQKSCLNYEIIQGECICFIFICNRACRRIKFNDKEELNSGIQNC